MRRIGVTVGIVMVALLSSCSGSRTVSAPEPEQRADASVSIALQADGQASMSLTLSRFDPITTPALARRVAQLAFPGSDAVTVDDDRSNGHTVALRVGSAFVRGRPASYRFPGAPLFTAFREGGFTTGDLTLCWPDVPAEVHSEARVTPVDDCLRWWGNAIGHDIPAVEIVLHPEPWRWVVGMSALVLSLLAAAVALVSAKSWTARRWTFPGVVVAATVTAGAFGQVAIWAGGAAGMTTNLLLTGVGGLAQTSVLVATALLATASLTLVMVCLGISIHTAGTWSSAARIVRTVPPRSDRTSA
jgi:hypothetical protein